MIVRPGTTAKIEIVQRQEQMPVTCQKQDSVYDVVRLGVVHDPMQANATPAGFQSAITLVDDVSITLGCVVVDVEQPVAVRSGTGTTGTGLNAKQVIQ